MSEPRAYESPLRERQRAETREQILQAAIDLLAEEGELTVPDVAKRAGVATRTVYFHFESKSGLMDALSDVLDAEIGVFTFPESEDELIDYSKAFWERFLENEKVWRVLYRSRAGADVRERGRGRRFASFKRAIGSRLDGLDPADRDVAAAVLYMQFGLAMRFGLLDQFGLTTEQAGRGITWSMQALLAELERNPSGPIE